MGGVAGHMAHLSEDLDLTFNEIVSILSKVASADIKNATEKVDGQNLFLTVANGEIRTARNNGDVKKGGMSTDAYISKWKGHPAENAFTNGFKAISAALRKLNPETLEDIFSNGQRYVNMEIMYPKNPNIISYSAPNIVLHGLQYFGDQESPQEQSLAKEKFNSLVKAVDGETQNVGEEDWSINGPKIVALKKLADGTALDNVVSKIQSFASPVGMNAKLGDYVATVVEKYTEQIGLPNNVTEQVLMLMLDPEEAKSRGITVVKAKKGLPKELQTVVSKLGSKTNSRKYISSVLRPLEIAISDFAIEVLRGVKSFFVDEHDDEVQRMQDELQQSIVYLKNLQSSGDEKMGELVDKQLAKLGKIENLASSLEGVVFEYPPGSDRIYKLTGAFAMANQIIGRARRSGMNEQINIQISKNKQVTKTIGEWLVEIKKTNHTYQKPPQFVYKDILAGAPIVEIVSQENAEETIYNTIITYVNNLHEEMIATKTKDLEDPIVMKELEDENDDPVIDIEIEEEPEPEQGRTIAIVPGAFKPPHKGHLDMVIKYLNGEGISVPKADEVYVIISKPTKQGRYLPDGTEVGVAESENLWNQLIGGMPGVKVIPSETHASPINAGYEMVGKNTDIPAGTNIILGASKKGDDWKRWQDAHKYVSDTLNLIDPEESAVEPKNHDQGYLNVLMQPENEQLFSGLPSVKSNKDPNQYHASDFRYMIGEAATNPVAKKLLESFIGQENVNATLSTFGYPTDIEELSANVAGALQGPVVKKRKEKRRESVNLNYVDDVIKLIMERGILQ